jgi:hypothetical protein
MYYSVLHIFQPFPCCVLYVKSACTWRWPSTSSEGWYPYNSSSLNSVRPWNSLNYRYRERKSFIRCYIFNFVAFDITCLNNGENRCDGQKRAHCYFRLSLGSLMFLFCSVCFLVMVYWFLLPYVFAGCWAAIPPSITGCCPASYSAYRMFATSQNRITVSSAFTDLLSGKH